MLLVRHRTNHLRTWHKHLAIFDSQHVLFSHSARKQRGPQSRLFLFRCLTRKLSASYLEDFWIKRCSSLANSNLIRPCETRGRYEEGKRHRTRKEREDTLREPVTLVSVSNPSWIYSNTVLNIYFPAEDCILLKYYLNSIKIRATRDLAKHPSWFCKSFLTHEWL